jgi:predicted transcriptional regulator
MKDELIELIKKNNKLLALMITKDLTQIEKMITLNKVGFLPTEIAELIGSTANSVRVALAKARKRGKI